MSHPILMLRCNEYFGAKMDCKARAARCGHDAKPAQSGACLNSVQTGLGYEGEYALFAHDPRRRGSRLRRGRCNDEREPEIPALRPVLSRKFPVRFDIHVTLQVADRKKDADLRTDTGNARPE